MKKYHVIKPNYYNPFVCKGSSCRYTCCQGWTIHLSKEEVRRTKQLLQEDSQWTEQKHFQRLSPEKRTRRVDSFIALNKEGMCPFLNEESLCALQCRYGAGALSATCKEFPRKLYRYGDTFFYALSPGCEKVLEVILYNKNKIILESFHEAIDHNLEIHPIVETDKKRAPIKDVCLDILNLSTALLQAEDVLLEDKIILLGIAMKRMDELIEEGKILEVPRFCEEFLSSLEAVDDVDTLLPKITASGAVLVNNFMMTVQSSAGRCKEDHIFTHAIKENLGITLGKEGTEVTASYSLEVYEKLQKEYEIFMQDKEHFIENILLSFLYFHQIPFWGTVSQSLWENYMYFVWFSGIVKFYLTASMPQIHSNEDMIARLAFIFREWGYSESSAKEVLKLMHENSCDDLAHLAVLLKSC